MTETQSVAEPVERKRVPFVFLLGVIALAGHFWPLLDRMLSSAILRASSARRGNEVESFDEFFKWPIAFTSIQLIVVTVLLVLWIAFGHRRRRRYPPIAIVLVAIAILSHFISPLLFAYVAVVHGAR